MSFITKPLKIAQMAIRAEEAGEKYYRKLAGHCGDTKVRELLAFFADQEKEHQETFRQMAQEAAGKDMDKEFSMDVVGLMQAGIESMQASGMGAGPEDPGGLDMRACLQTALNVELESVKLYQVIQDAYQGPYQEMLYRIIREENQHADMIRKALEKL